MAKENEAEKGRLRQVQQDLVIAVGIGVMAALAIGSVTVLLGQVGDAEAQKMLEAAIPTTRLFCSSMLTVAATILALMLTMIGLGHQAKTELADAHYHRIVKIAFYDAILFAGSAILFIIHCVPVYESDALPTWWYPSIYYALLIASSGLAGGAIAIIILLYLAVSDVVQVVALGQTEHRYAVETQSETSKDQRE